jgi:hypothetical protein
MENIYGTLMKIHISVGHGGRDRMLHRFKEERIGNLGRDTVEMFIQLCKECQTDKKKRVSGVVLSLNRSSRKIWPASSSGPH